MSNLLEQAIIDAAALRETALKSAESALIDKYKDEFEITVKKLLEQEDSAMTGGDPNAGAVPPEGNMASPDASGGISGDMSNEEPGGEAFQDIPSSFLDGDEDEMITIDFDKIEKQLQDVLSSPMLASPGSEEETGEEETEETPEAPEMEAGAMNEELELEESEELEEELDEELELEEEKSCEQDELEEMYDAGGRFEDYPKMDALSEMEDSEPAIHIQIVDDEEEQDEYEGESEEEFELDEADEAASSSQMQSLEKADADANAKIAAGQAAKARTQQQIAAIRAQELSKRQSDISTDQITEEEIQELDEEMHVDIDVEGLLSGYMGSTTRKKVERDDLAKAKARDSREIERMNLEREKLKDLENKLHESQSTNKKYSVLVEDLKENLNSLKEHVEKLSISNAKLLYINKVFGDSSLNERQKQNIVESISRATTVLEAKTIYGTLQSTVQSVQESRHKQSLSEALDRGSQAFITRPRAKSSIDDNLSERMKILAGISNKQ